MSPAVGLGKRSYLIDNSVFQRIRQPAVRRVWEDGVKRRRLVSCGPFVIEALYSAQNSGELEELQAELTGGLRYVNIDDAGWRSAFAAQRELARVTERFHRCPPIDYLIAATAHHHGLGVLHYDRDYDLIADHSSLEFESRWIAEPGSL